MRDGTLADMLIVKVAAALYKVWVTRSYATHTGTAVPSRRIVRLDVVKGCLN